MLVGIDYRLGAIYSLLKVGLDDVRYVGIWGIGGIGKTTLASVAYERLRNQFEVCCFLRNVREVSESDDGEVHLQTQLLSHLNLKGMVIENTYQGNNTIRNLFSNKRVLLVFDDVSSIDQLKNLAGSQEWFGVGSRVIITTRDMHLLISHEVHDTYKVESMNIDESFQLFSQNAFRGDQPKEGYMELSKSVVNYAGGLPLALCVLGSFLCGRNVSQWKDALDKLKKVPNNDILKKLRISYDALDETEQTIFLHIACFFNGWDTNKVTQILKCCGLNATIGINILVEKSLLNETSSQNGVIPIETHDLLVEMARSIVFQESPTDPGRRSRLWFHEDIHKVMNRNVGSEVIQGIVLHFNTHKAYWDPEAFSKMINIELLIITCYLNLPCGLICLPSALRFLQWNAYPLEDLPLGTQLDELVYLQMHNSKIKQLCDGKPCFENLKIMDLSHSQYLLKTPNFLGVPNLERLILEDCINLVVVHASLGQLNNLLVVNLKGCRNLKVLPTKLEVDSLKEFILCGCIQVKKLPEFGENMKNVEVLKLSGCKNLACLPHTIHNLKHLKSLDISGCSKFLKLPENLNKNEALEHLDASETAITEVPSSIDQLKNLKTLSFHGCKGSTSYSRWNFPLPWNLNNIFRRHSFSKDLVFPPSIFNLRSLEKLDLSNCNIDERSIPDDLGGLSSLMELNLSGNQFVHLPTACISNLSQLQVLHLEFCPKLQALPQAPPSLFYMNARESASLETLCDQQLSLLFAPTHPREPIWAHNGIETMVRTDFEAIISGSEIPSWFKNQNHFTLDENGEFSMTIEVSPCKRSGFALCVVLDDKFFDFEAERRIHYGWTVEYCAKCPDEIYKSHHRLLGWPVQSGMNSPHLWLLFGGIQMKDFITLPVNLNILRFTFYTAYNPKTNNSDFPETRTVKCGWVAISQEYLEEWECCVPRFMLKRGADSRGYPTLYYDRHWRDGWIYKIHDASMRNKGEEKRISGLNFKRTGESVVCKSEQATNCGPPKKKSKNGSPELLEEASHHSEAHP